MARPLKRRVENELQDVVAPSKGSQQNQAGLQTEEEKRRQEVLRYIELVNVVRNARDKRKSDDAYNEILRMMDSKIQQISRRFQIPGHHFNDVYQEALIALRWKAIKDYDQNRSSLEAISPFDKFAILCIRRHLSTKLKASYQNKAIVLNQAGSLDQDRNRSSNSDDLLFLSDIVPESDKDILSQLHDTEYRKILFSKLLKKLSPFEKEVFVLYVQKFSYDEITRRLRRKDEYRSINSKSIDNARSRIVNKARAIYAKYG